MFDTNLRLARICRASTLQIQAAVCASVLGTVACNGPAASTRSVDQNRSRITPGLDDPDTGQGDDGNDPEDAGVAAVAVPDAGATSDSIPDVSEGTDGPTPGAPSEVVPGNSTGQGGSAESVNRAASCPNGLVEPRIEPMPIGKGLIIPAYITLDDRTSWNILKEGVETLRTNGSPIDYWVTVNGPGSAPFVKSEDWATAKTLYDPIRCNGGAIVGYVHTCEAATPPRMQQTTFRPLETVEAEIDRWVNGYPALDGIWLDEFIPRLEVASIVEPGQPLIINPGPNPEYQPLSPDYLTDGAFNGKQVDPRGGYYHQLRQWIRDAHPNLRIIGNAGGWLDNNQIEYPKLVDVFVSFEQTYALASQNNWTRLDRQVDTVPQLALIHTNTTDLAGAVKQAFDHKYTHVYTTSLPLYPNVWGALPPYFTTEVATVGAMLGGQ